MIGRTALIRVLLPAAFPPAMGLTLVLLPLAVLSSPEQNPTDGCGTGGTAATVDDVRLDAVQMSQAQIIVDVAARSALGPQAAVVALAAAYQESRLRMLANDGSSPDLTKDQAATTASSLQYSHDGVASDHDSVNTFQQRWLAGWGTVAQLMDPVYAAEAFFHRLAAVPYWQDTPVAQAAQAVQISAGGSAYARWEPLARQLTAMLWPTAASSADVGATSAVCPPMSVASGTWIKPTSGTVTSPYGMRDGVLHAGIDIAGTRGSPVYAAADGVVVRAACTSAYCDHDGSLRLAGYGNLVELDNGGGVHTLYGHLTAYVVAPGQQVTVGSLVGYQGATGNVTGVHLHFEVRQDGVAVDPASFMADHGVDLYAPLVAGAGQ